MEHLTKEYAEAMLKAYATDTMEDVYDPTPLREALKADGLTPDTIVKADVFEVAAALAYALYKPTDKGREGKNGEVVIRIAGWLEGGRTWAHWSEFFARKSGDADCGESTEVKTGVGDWLYSKRHSDRESIIEEYRKKTTTILWDTPDFTIEASWCDLLEYLEGYNAKGLDTWFKSNVRFNPTVRKTVVMMQEYRSSKKKLNYLLACPYRK